MIGDCAAANGDDTDAILKCVEEVMDGVADCVECICDVLAVLFNVDIEPCSS